MKMTIRVVLSQNVSKGENECKGNWRVYAVVDGRIHNAKSKSCIGRYSWGQSSMWD